MNVSSRERGFDDDQRMLEPVAARAGRTAAAVPHRVLWRESRSAQRRHESEGQSGGDRYGRRKRQHAPVEREPGRVARRLGHQPFEKAHGGNRESYPAERSQCGERQALGEELTDEPSAPGAQRHAHRDFPAAGGAAREQQIRQIDACDQQERGRRPEQHGQRGLRPASDLVAQRNDEHRMRTAEILRSHLQTQRPHRFPCLLQGDAGLEPRDDHGGVPGEVGPLEGRKRRRQPEIDVA